MSKSSVFSHPAAICLVVVFSLMTGYLYQLTTFIIRGDFSYLGITSEQPVLVYSRTDCEACRSLKNMLSEHNIPARYIELDQQPTEQELKNFSALGYQQVPVMITQHKLITGFHRPAIFLVLAGI